VRPNKRLKLTGGDRSNGSGVLCPWWGTDCRPLLLRRRAGRPQLKRDPLGGALPLHRHSFVNSFVTVIARGAVLRYSRISLGSPGPTTQGHAIGMPRRAPPSTRWLPRRQPRIPRASAGFARRAARSSIGAGRAV
jgi:hypothetical protein